MPIITITPVAKVRMTQRDKWAVRPPVMRYRAFGDELRLKLPRYVVPGKVKLIFWMPMPKSWSKKKREKMDGQPHKQKPDIDNLVKAVLDHLCEDDSYVYDLQATKLWGVEGKIYINEII